MGASAALLSTAATAAAHIQVMGGSFRSLDVRQAQNGPSFYSRHLCYRSRVRWGLLFICGTAWANPLHPRHIENTRPPTPLLGIAADIRRVSGDASFRIDPPEKE